MLKFNLLKKRLSVLSKNRLQISSQIGLILFSFLFYFIFLNTFCYKIYARRVRETTSSREILNDSSQVYPKPLREDRWEVEIRFDDWAEKFYRLERKIRLVYKDKLQTYIDELKKIYQEIDITEVVDDVSYLTLAKQSEKLRYKIRLCTNRFSRAYKNRDEQGLAHLNKEVIQLLKHRLKIELQLAYHWLEVAKSDRRRLVAAINALRGAERTSRRISIEYGWQRRRETGTGFIKRFKTVGIHGQVVTTFLYIDLDIKVHAPDKEYPDGRITVRQQRWVTIILDDGTGIIEKRWRDIPYEDWSAALRSQIHTLASQEIDYQTVLNFLADLEYCCDRLCEYRKETLPGYLYEQIEGILKDTFLWTSRGFVDGKRLASVNLEFALAKLKEDDIDTVLKEVTEAIGHLEARLQEIEDISKRGVAGRLESIYFHIRNSDIIETLKLAKQELTAGNLEETQDLVAELYQNYFTAIVEEGSYKYFQRKITAISSAIANLNAITLRKGVITAELRLRKLLYNSLHDQLSPLKRERDRLERKRLLPEVEFVRLQELRDEIRQLENIRDINYKNIKSLTAGLEELEKLYSDNLAGIYEEIDIIASAAKTQFE